MIKEFQNEYRFLSNFWPSPIKINHQFFTTVEHFYQYSKCKNETDRINVLCAPTPGSAKRRGSKVELVDNWDNIKNGVMLLGVTEKFLQNPHLAQKLIDTHPQEIYEGNTWGDTYWGVMWNPQGTNYIGENNLGKILMRVREAIIKVALAQKEV